MKSEISFATFPQVVGNILVPAVLLALAMWAVNEYTTHAHMRHVYACPGSPITVLGPAPYQSVSEVRTVPSLRLRGFIFTMPGGRRIFEAVSSTNARSTRFNPRLRDPSMTPREGEVWSSFVQRAFIDTYAFVRARPGERVATFACARQDS